MPLCALGAIPLVLGGDHSILLGELRAHAAAHGPLGLLLLDAHADTWDDYYGERLFHGTVIRRATEEGLLDPSRSLIAGVRGSLYAPADLEDARARLRAGRDRRAAGERARRLRRTCSRAPGRAVRVPRI
jgi:agmatinase